MKTMTVKRFTYRAMAYPNGTNQESVVCMFMRLREAQTFARVQSRRLGVGARGVVMTGKRYDGVKYACRIGLTNAGKPKVISEES